MAVRIRTRFINAVCLAGLLLGAAEACLQASRLLDTPLYDVNSRIGYIPRPGQRGAYLYLHDFEFNRLSMGAGRFAPSESVTDVLLIGDSIVMGGNHYSQADRLGPQLSKQSAWNVWPISAGSWALQNELTYVREHLDDLREIDIFAFVLNSGDFDGPSSWRSALTHPRVRPFPALLFAFRKFVNPIWDDPPTPPDLVVPFRPWQKDLSELAVKLQRPIYVFLYPDHEEMSDPELLHARLDRHVGDLRAALGSRGKVVTIATCDRWRRDFYRDEIHPTVEGTGELARIIRDTLVGNLCTK